MIEVTNNTDVYTARDEHVGSVGRIVLDPRTRAISHVVVRKGIVFREDRLVPIGDIATATAERINLRQDLGVDDFVPFIGQHYVPLDDADRPAALQDQVVRLAMPLSGPVGEVMPTPSAELVPVRERNIPDRLTAVEADVPVFASDHQEVGRLQRILATASGEPTHIVVEEGGLVPDRRALPIEWVQDIAEDAIALDATRHTVEAIAPLAPGD